MLKRFASPARWVARALTRKREPNRIGARLERLMDTCSARPGLSVVRGKPTVNLRVSKTVPRPAPGASVYDGEGVRFAAAAPFIRTFLTLLALVKNNL